MRGRIAALTAERPFLATCVVVLGFGAAMTVMVLVAGTAKTLSLGAPWLVALWAVQLAVLLALLLVLVLRPPDRTGRTAMAIALVTVNSTIILGIAVEPDRLDPLTARLLLIVAAGGALVRSFPLMTLVIAAAAGLWAWVRVTAVPSPQPAEDWPLSWAVAVAASYFLVFVITREGRQAQEVHGRLRVQAEHDILTGLANRAGLRARGPSLIADAGTHAGTCWCAFVDVDQLKQVNDIHGHASGDDLLRALARALTGAARSDDMVCRWGGDEFVIVGRGREPQGPDLETRVLDLMAQECSSAPWWPTWSGAVSVGIASVPSPGDARESETTLDRLLAEADAAMYRRRRERRR